MKKRIKKIAIILGVLVIVATLSILAQRFQSQFDDKNILLEFRNNNVIPKQSFIPFQKYKISSFTIGDINKPKILFIHGSPGYWFDFKNVFMDSLLQANYCMISFDRPGYGNTNIPPQTSLKNQARVAAAVMKYYGGNFEKCIIVGHSYGGAILEQCMLDYSNRISNAIYVAPCLSPAYQKAKWYNLIASGGLSKKIIPNALSISNMEMMALSDNLKKNESRLSEINLPTYYIQGKKDVLVPYKTLYLLFTIPEKDKLSVN